MVQAQARGVTKLGLSGKAQALFLSLGLVGALWCGSTILPDGDVQAAPAQAASQASSASGAASAAREALQAKLAALSGFSAHFKQEVTDIEGQMVAQSEGMLYLQRPDRFMMHTTSPDELRLYTQEGDIYYFDAAVNQVSIFALDRSFSNPLLLLTSSDDKLWQEYSVSESDNRFTLVPHTAKDLRSITISFTEAGQGAPELLESLTMRMDDGNTNFYLFSQQKDSVEESSFSFELPDDVEIDDAR